MSGIFHLGAGTATGRYSLGGRASLLTPAQAHVQRMRAAAPTSSGYYRADDYTASLTQAGLFVDAFGGALTYASPNIMASPTRVVDGTTGMVSVMTDGADDVTFGSGEDTVAALVFLCRTASPENTLQSIFGSSAADCSTRWNSGSWGNDNASDLCFNQAVQVNGVATHVQPSGQWTVTAMYTDTVMPQAYGIFASFLASRYWHGGMCELVKWSTAPSLTELAAAAQTMMTYYSQQYGLTF